MIRYLIGAVAGVLVMMLVVTPYQPVYRNVVVSAARIVEREPPASPPTIVEKVVYQYLQPSVQAEAPGGALGDVQSFCKPVVVAVTDTVLVPDRQLLLRSVSVDPGWFLGKDEVFVSGLTNTGDLWSADYRVRPGAWSARVAGDSILMRQPRTSIIRQGAELAAPVAIGWIACSLFKC